MKREKFETCSGWQFHFHEKYGITWKQIFGKENNNSIVSAAYEWKEKIFM